MGSLRCTPPPVPSILAAMLSNHSHRPSRWRSLKFVRRGHPSSTSSRARSTRPSLPSRFFSRMCDVIFENEGTLDKFIGDAMMVVFNAPFEQKDHALRAASGGTRLSLSREQQVLSRFRAELGPDGAALGMMLLRQGRGRL